MQKFPHRYKVAATAQSSGNVALSSPDLSEIDSGPPAEFGGPGDLWSPETLFVAAIADCFVLTFRAIARASGIDWVSLNCDATGILDRIERVTQFTKVELRVVLVLSDAAKEQKALQLLAKAERGCLITNSLKTKTHLDAEVRIET